jgi:hypothetical protein
VLFNIVILSGETERKTSNYVENEINKWGQTLIINGVCPCLCTQHELQFYGESKESSYSYSGRQQHILISIN